MLFDLASDSADITLRNDVSIVEQDHGVGDHVHFMKYVAGDNDVKALFGQAGEELDRLRTHHGIQTVERLVQKP